MPYMPVTPQLLSLPEVLRWLTVIINTACNHILLSWLTGLTLAAAILHLHVSCSPGRFDLDSSMRFDLSARSVQTSTMIHMPRAPATSHLRARLMSPKGKDSALPPDWSQKFRPSPLEALIFWIPSQKALTPFV